jgi:hypothetical protein
MRTPEDGGPVPPDEGSFSGPLASRPGARPDVLGAPNLRKRGGRTLRVLGCVACFVVCVVVIAFLDWFFFLRPTKLAGRWEAVSREPADLRFQAVLREDGTGVVIFSGTRGAERYKFTYRVQGNLLRVQFEGKSGAIDFRMEMRENWLGLWAVDSHAPTEPPLEFHRIGDE